MSEEQALREAYKIRDIPTRQLPASSALSRMTQGYKRSSTKLDLAHGSGSSQSIRATWAATDFIEGPLDAPAIVLIEYDLPYHAAVILLPEYPFELQNKIRAVFCRAPRADEEI